MARSAYMGEVTGPGPRIVGHHGGGGTMGWADLDTGLSVMYTHNRFGTATPFAALAKAVREVAADHGAR
jgi:CubicO group peptidase (beta-lactamase class C family)